MTWIQIPTGLERQSLVWRIRLDRDPAQRVWIRIPTGLERQSPLMSSWLPLDIDPDS